MANVEAAAGRSDSRNRAQLLVTTALALAVLFVVLATLLNAVIYTENLATQTADVRGSEVVGYRNAAISATSGIVERTNGHRDTTYADLKENLTASLGNWSGFAGRHRAIDGQFLDVSVLAVTNGTRIVQDSAREFTDGSGARDWTLAENVGNTRRFRIEVHRDELADSDAGFTLIARNDAASWTMAVYKDDVDDDGGGEIVAEVDSPSGDTSCSQAATEARINVTEGSFGGCRFPTFPGSLDGEYDVRYENADRVHGTYDLVVDERMDIEERTDGDDTSYNPDASGDSPYLTPAIYSTTIDFTYESPRLRYGTEIRVAPGESDD